MTDTLLDHLARSRGIGEAYYDYRGELKVISAATKAGILGAMGCRVDDADAISREIADVDAGRWRAMLAPVAVVKPGRSGVAIAIPADQLDRMLEWTVRCSDGQVKSAQARAGDLTESERRELDGRWLTRRLLVLPENLPGGYHSLRLEIAGGESAECVLVVAPSRCYEPGALSRGRRLWGVAVQLYTLRTESNWGIGDFADLETLIRLTAVHGAAFVGLNPLHALFPANPRHFSPYSPSSRQFLNVLYIAVEQLPEYAECDAVRAEVAREDFQRELARLRGVANVDYAGVARAKLPVLEKLHAYFRRQHLAVSSERAEAFRTYQRDRGMPLRLHALYDAIDAHLRALDDARYWGWPVWPQELRDPHGPAVREFERVHAESVEFFAWLQWLAEEQLAGVQRTARELGMPLGLYGDYAVGVNPAGSETWSDHSVYRMEAGIGAPPDPLALKGQDWGIPPQDPHALIRAAYRPFRDLVSANMRHFGALRLDHVMALFRQWWVPRGSDASDGGYVHYPLDDLMSVLALESARNRCLVIGEDLGTVPDEMRQAMAEFAVYSYKVLLFEKHADGRFRQPEEFVRRAIATVTTHDLPTLRGYWEGGDLELRDRLRLFPTEDVRRHLSEERARDRAQLLSALETAGLRPQACSGADARFSESLARAVQVYLARSAAALVVLQIEDLIGMSDPVNVPGTSDEHANWQRKVTADLRDALGRETTQRVFAEVQAARSS